MKSFLELARSRYSLRSYLEKPIEKEKLDYILECGRVAPSAANFQPWTIKVLEDKSSIDSISVVYPREWFKTAAVVLVICSDHQLSWKRPDGKDHCDIDAAIITDHITLAAAEQGLGSCWICHFDAGQCAAFLHLPDHIEPIVILTLGYPADTSDTPRHHNRKSYDEIVQKIKL